MKRCTAFDILKLLFSVLSNELGPRIAANVAIAIEHIVLRALDYGLSYPAESLAARKRLQLKDILID